MDSSKTEIAYLGGGCFWGLEDLLAKQPGVVSTEVGYMGGALESPEYEDVKEGDTDHAETVKVIFDTSLTNYENILLYFFKIHDPTTLNQQGNDIGTQYRSVIFATSEEQKNTATKVIEKVNTSGVWKRPVVTAIVQAPTYWPAEDYHQKYLQKKPNGYTCHFERKINF